MKTAILAFTLLAATTVCWAQQNKTQIMLQKENLKGKVKTVYMTNGSDYIKTWFDETGKKTRAEMKYLSNPLFIEDNYVYDSSGRLLSYLSYRIDRQDDMDISKFVYEYNSRGLLEKDGTANITATGMSRSPIFHTLYKYDEKGNCIEVRKLGNNADDFDIVTRMIYNTDNRIVEEFMYTEDDGIENDSAGGDKIYLNSLSKDHTFYEYNEQGDVSLITIKNKEGEVTRTGVVTYKYDGSGNWIEQTDPSQMAQYSTLGKHLTRIIEYYE